MKTEKVVVLGDSQTAKVGMKGGWKPEEQMSKLTSLPLCDFLPELYTG